MDKGFNDIVAQLYEKEFKTQEKAKYEHIRQSKEKAIEEQRVEAKGRKKLVEKMKMRELYQTKQLMALLGRIGLA